MSRKPQAAVPDGAVRLPVADGSQVGEARRRAAGLASRLGFTEADAGRVALVVTEVATNLVAHARWGEILVRALEGCGGPGIEVLALDRGPGMASVEACLRDGYSTRGSPGTGFGAVARLSAVFDVHSEPGIGTVLLARLWPGAPAGPVAGRRRGLEVGAVSVPKPGENVCGDGWAVEHRPGSSLLLVSDGIGHGPPAAAASREAVRVLQGHTDSRPGRIVEAAHAALRGTRGAALAVAEVDLADGVVRFAGVGNVSGTVLAPGRSHSMVSHNGTAGHEVRRIREFSYGWPPGALLVMHSDGLATRWCLDRYRGLAARHPGVIAGVLYRDFARLRDDVTVLVARERERGAGRR